MATTTKIGPLTVITSMNQNIKKITFTGPIQVVERQLWAKFGKACNEPSPTVYESNEILIEFKGNENETESNDYEYMSYSIIARREGWSFLEIEEINKSLNPAEAFRKIFKRKLDVLFHSIDAKYNPILAELKLQEIQAAKEQEKAREETREKSREETSKTQTQEPKGLRARFSAKLAENDTRERDREKEPVKSSLSSRLKKNKQDKLENEQESTLFVSNVPLEYTENDIRYHLADRFRVTRINVVRKAAYGSEERISVGSAFVVCINRDEADACLNFLHGYRWDNLIAAVSFSEK